MIVEKYAKLIVNYCLDIQEGEKVFIQSSTLAEPLIKEVYSEILKSGGHPEVQMQFREQNASFFKNASKHQLEYVSPVSELLTREFDAHLYIRAPFNLKEDLSIDPDKRKTRNEAFNSLNELFSVRTGSGQLKRTLCQYPTDAAAQEAGMSLTEYQDFVYKACQLHHDDPRSKWLELREKQQKIVDFLQRKSMIRYKNDLTDIRFSTKDRTWINSDGRTNMPSGEVFTGPEESSVNGTVYFDYPSIYLGKEVQGVRLEVENGKVEKWSAKIGEEYLNEVLAIEGSRYFGEVAIGTNYEIQRATKNILFDEKIGGTIHMALGQSYKQTGGKNKSAVHWDLIADMKTNAFIYADDELIYQNGKFLIF